MSARHLVKFEVLSLTALALISFAWIIINMPTYENEIPLLAEEKLEVSEVTELQMDNNTLEADATNLDTIEADHVDAMELDEAPIPASESTHTEEMIDEFEESVSSQEGHEQDQKSQLGNDDENNSDNDEHYDGEDHDDDEEDEKSSTSTDQFCDHESWATYEAKVASFCHALWPSLKPEEILIERMKGGSDNRIVGITLQPRQKLLPRLMRRLRSYAARQKPTAVAATRYILRIPRFAKDRNLSEDIGLLEYARRLGIPVPIVVKADYTSQNALEKPYLLQVRASGSTLDYLWDDLNRKQRLCVAKQVADILVKTSSQRSKVCGKVIGTESSSPIKTWEKSGMVPKIVLPSFMKYATKSASDLGRNFWQNPPRLMIPATLREWNHYKPYILPWDKLARLTESMQETSGVFSSDEYWFGHGDFWPRNMLAEVTGPGTARITAILDWDLSSFAPAVVACNPPTWMWQWGEYCRHDSGRPEEAELDKMAAGEPADEESREIKRCFEEIVGSEFLKYAYHTDGHMARRLYPWATEATMYCEDRDVAEEMLAEWQEKYGEDDDEVWCETEQ